MPGPLGNSAYQPNLGAGCTSTVSEQGLASIRPVYIMTQRSFPAGNIPCLPTLEKQWPRSMCEDSGNYDLDNPLFFILLANFNLNPFLVANCHCDCHSFSPEIDNRC